MISFGEVINIESVKKMAENIYAISGIPMGIINSDGTIEVAVGWQDICTKFHRVNKITCQNCLISDLFFEEHINDSDCIGYKCLNNMWDIAIPIIISEVRVATLFFGQFFYDDEIIDIEYFRKKALEYGFDEKEYIEALNKVPRFSKAQVNHVIQYYNGLIMTLVESGLRQLEYKKSEERFQKSQEYLNTIFNSVNDAIFICDFNGYIVDVNETARNMFIYSINEFIGKNISDIISSNSPRYEFDLREVISRVRRQKQLVHELICKDKNNGEFWLEINVRIANINGEERILGTARNITERKQSELALKNQALELEKIRTEFFANISHELRTPLNILLCSNKVISMNIRKEIIDKEKILDNVTIQTQNCFRLIRLVNNLIDVTKLDSGFIETNLVNCNIINIIEDIILSVADYVKNNNLNLIFDTELEEKIVACDLDKMERIMLNLLSNAVKFTKPGGNILVNIADGEEYITISVEDDGIGIPKDKLDIIFDRFRQVDKSFTRNNEGSGIGLSIVKPLVEMQGGKIFVESEYGVGTKFIIKFSVKTVDYDNSLANYKLTNNSLNNRVEKIKIEFSDIYAI
ncbi:PocR ligand-binding domain-containing protein [Clostridium sp.]|uniref:PocR ligand-binding domain-containing protein n=1 Tax=Clostridium sp. TaxID=1506 RepID=UPI00283FC4C6|nr:PocR ligand-binding domain-containing protein [Clostridium sp.]MDR3598093.1 PocR ligand-binding domain-containing protein [Clostridium sp.]